MIWRIYIRQIDGLGRPKTVQSGPGEQKPLIWRIYIRQIKGFWWEDMMQKTIKMAYIYAICKAKWKNVTYRKPLIWRIYIRHFKGFLHKILPGNAFDLAYIYTPFQWFLSARGCQQLPMIWRIYTPF